MKRSMHMLLAFLMVLTMVAPGFCATRTMIAQYWSYPGSWAEGSVPTDQDDVVPGAGLTNVNINSGAAVCKTINLTGYTGGITWASWSKLTTNGDTILEYGYMSGSEGATLRLQGTGSYNYKCAWLSANLEIINAPTINLMANTGVSKTLTCLSQVTFNGASYKITLGQVGNNFCLISDYDIYGSASVEITGGIIDGLGVIHNPTKYPSPSGTVKRCFPIKGSSS